MMQCNGQGEGPQQHHQQQQQQQHHQYQGFTNPSYQQPAFLGRQQQLLPAGTDGSFMAGLQNDSTLGRYPSNYCHRTNDSAAQLQSFDNAPLDPAGSMQPNLGSNTLWPSQQEGYGPANAAADPSDFMPGLQPSEPSSSPSFPNLESLGPGEGLASFCQRRLQGLSDQAKPPPMQLSLRTNDDVGQGQQKSALGAVQQFPNLVTFDSPSTASTADSMAHHFSYHNQYSLPTSPLHFLRESWTEGARPAEQSSASTSSSMQQISGMPSFGSQSDYSCQFSNLTNVPQFGQGSSSLSREEGSSNTQLTQSRRNSSMSLADGYGTSDDKRAQEILKLLRSRAPDSKESGAACDYCRKRRIKCDRDKPTCGRCTIAGRPCTTSHTLRKSGPPSKKEREFLAAQGI
ncbi:unnamed protein product [Sympodiomycopsis kandeliae]